MKRYTDIVVDPRRRVGNGPACGNDDASLDRHSADASHWKPIRAFGLVLGAALLWLVCVALGPFWLAAVAFAPVLYALFRFCVTARRYNLARGYRAMAPGCGPPSTLTDTTMHSATGVWLSK